MINDDLMTIKELAEKLDTTKNKVAYQVRKLDVENIEIIKGTQYLNKQAQSIISDAIKQLNSDELNSDKQHESVANDAIVIDLLKQRINSLESNIESLNSHLQAKDKQINQLHTIIATQSQQTNIKALEHENSKKWWQRIFK